MKKKGSITIFALVFGGLLLASTAHAEVVFPATTPEEFEALVASNPQEATFIRTQQDFEAYKAIAKFPGHPLRGLTAQQLAEWSATVWIADGGLVSMDIGILQSNLSPRNYSDALAAFGVHVVLAKDYEDMYCEKRATCSLKYFSVCTSNC